MSRLQVAVQVRHGGAGGSLRRRQRSFTLDIAFDSDGPVTALIGPSGAGKTTTLRALAGLVRAQGRIGLGQRVLLDTGRGIDVPARHRRIGMVFQHYALFPHLDVAANIAYGLAGWDRGEARERVEALLALVDLEAHRHARPADLSGGQQQRVALARALAPGPELLLLDEPLSAADPRLRHRLRAHLAELLGEAGTPALLVTHDAEDVRALAQQVVALDQGRVVAQGGLELL